MPLTEEDFLNLPEFIGRQEFRDGELIELLPAEFKHSELVHRLFHLLRATVEDSRIWMETAFHLRKNRWAFPDVSVTWPGQPVVDDWFHGSPMIPIELASRGYTPDELQQKVTDYLLNGAAEVWVIYPKSHTMLVHRPDSVVSIAADATYHCEMIGVAVTPEYRTEID
jgi:Uma2 family endonuclease